jgi:hypothetical protein
VCTNNNKISRLDELVFYLLLLLIIFIILLRAKMGSICIDLFMSFDKKKGVTKRNYIIFLEVRIHVVAWIVQVPHPSAENL